MFFKVHEYNWNSYVTDVDIGGKDMEVEYYRRVIIIIKYLFLPVSKYYERKTIFNQTTQLLSVIKSFMCMGPWNKIF